MYLDADGPSAAFQFDRNQQAIRIVNFRLFSAPTHFQDPESSCPSISSLNASTGNMSIVCRSSSRWTSGVICPLESQYRVSQRPFRSSSSQTVVPELKRTPGKGVVRTTTDRYDEVDGSAPSRYEFRERRKHNGSNHRKIETGRRAFSAPASAATILGPRNLRSHVQSVAKD